jgi:outer membrane protein
MLKKLALAAISFVFAGAAAASCCGVVDMDSVVKAVPQVKALQASIQKEFQPRQKKLIALQKKFQDAQDKFKKNQAVMSKSALEKAAQDLQQQAQTIQQGQMGFQKELVAAQNDAMKKFFDQVKVVAKTVAKDNKLDAILPANGLLYSAKSVDYTKQIIAALKKK